MSSEREQNAEGYVFLMLSFNEERGTWTGRCTELGTTIQSRSLKEAHAELTELVETYLNQLVEAGEEQRFFVENDIEVFGADSAPIEAAPCPAMIAGRDHYLHAHRFTIRIRTRR
ncbi:MAG: hypothetical protein M0Z94_11165 [Dehalococcoidales bacterium]|nr:hypothetical protein [Dehalococcoidales bacterium]